MNGAKKGLEFLESCCLQHKVSLTLTRYILLDRDSLSLSHTPALFYWEF